MKILNLYSGLGGNRKNWANHEITSVENDVKIADVYRGLYPKDTVIIGDAHDFLINNYKYFDFVWSSPPCQSHSKMNKATRHNTVRYFDMQLWQEIIFLKHFFKGKFVVENVIPYYDPLVKPSVKIGRHLFWSNFDIPVCEVETPKNFIKGDSPNDLQYLKDWLGIQYTGNIYYGKNHSPAQVLRNCVHPIIGEHILNTAFSTL